jgi:hypothetical protein
MRFSLTALVRLALLVAVASTVLAIEVARFARAGLHERFAPGSRLVGINGLLFPGADYNARFVDPKNGAIGRLRLPPGACLDNVAISPWRDEAGASLVVGRWHRESGAKGEELLTELGLACYTYPQGEEVARVSSDVVPQSGTCWYRGDENRVLFAAADGQLYHMSFGANRRAGVEPATDEDEPELLRWAVAPPGEGPVLIREPYWPSRLAGFDRTLVVSLRYLRPGVPDEGFTPAEIWWLRLDAAGTSIVAAGRLTVPTQEEARDECAPSVAETPGGLVLAYVSMQPATGHRNLRIAPVGLDSRSGVPRADTLRGIVLTEGCAEAAAAFSPDGRRVFALVHPNQLEARVERFDLPAEIGPPAHGG